MEKKKKNEFINKLTTMTPEEINTFIRDKGKSPKLVKPLQKVVMDLEGNEVMTI